VCVAERDKIGGRTCTGSLCGPLVVRAVCAVGRACGNAVHMSVSVYNGQLLHRSPREDKIGLV
jgi:hypothetical protein